MVRIKFTDGAENIQETVTDILKKNKVKYELSYDPQYVFCSVFGKEHLKYDCIRIWWTGENVRPDFNLFDYAIGFDHMSFDDRYIRVPLYCFYRAAHEMAIKKHLNVSKDMCSRKFCNFVYSNSNAIKKRQEIFEALCNYKNVDSGGRYLNNIGGPVEDKNEFQQKYKFSIAVENSETPGYTTEKIIQAFAAGTVPIYWGNERIAEEFNEDSFVNCHRFSDIDSIVSEIERLDNDDEAYLKCLKSPIYTDDKRMDDALEKLSAFLMNIFEKDYKDGIRVHESAWKDNMFRQQDLLKKLDDHRVIKKLISLR